ncbi:MAG: glyoxalase [Lachnospiraceae bacterium]|nr:glyoxalase [Lachnospiraceae bacterium]
MEYDEICLKTFLEKQGQLFDEPVAQTLEEAEYFLEDCMAAVFQNLKEVKRYFKENLDASGMSDQEILEACEVFPLPDGRFLVVEG